MSENKFTDTLNQLLDQLETVKTEIEKQNALMKQMEASNKELRGIVCEFTHYLAYPAYVLRPETVKTIINIAAEERAGR